MRVSHVITRLIVGGAQENTVSTVLGLQSRPDVQVDLISGPTNESEGSLESFFTKEHSLQIVPELVRRIHPASDWKALQKLTAIFEKTKPGIVHTHSGKAGILGRIAAHRAGIPVIIHTIHGPSFGSFQTAPANFIFRAAEKYAARFTTHFISVADAMTEQYLAAGIGRPQDYTRIFSGFNMEPFLLAQNDPVFREKLGLAPDDFVVGKIARLVEL
ncbi:MAG: glycosyltransferase, partial [Verrucomicrobiota bacterium]